VVHDAQHPLRVHAGRAVAMDVGTRFDVQAYRSDSAVRVVVTEGSVSLGASRPPLVAGELAVVNATGDVSAPRRVDADRYLGWTTGRLAFEDAPLAAVVVELSRWYGAAIVVADAPLRGRDVSITLEPQSLESALQLVGAVVAARVERRGKTYVFTSSHP
jgi:transmembrane sensor